MTRVLFPLRRHFHLQNAVLIRPLLTKAAHLVVDLCVGSGSQENGTQLGKVAPQKIGQSFPGVAMGLWRIGPLLA